MTSSNNNPPWLFSAFRNFNERHERLKKAIHDGWRYPLPRWGQFVMGVIYFSIPVVGGYCVMQWAISKSHESIGEKGELLNEKHVQGIGDKRVLDDGRLEQVGAGGVGGGVRLATSDIKTQEQNKSMLEAFFKEQRKRERRRREQAKQKGIVSASEQQQKES